MEIQGKEGASSTGVWGKNILAQRLCTCKGPEVRVCLAHWMNSEGSVAEQTDQVETEGRGETGRAGKGGQAAGPQAPAHALALL